MSTEPKRCLLCESIANERDLLYAGSQYVVTEPGSVRCGRGTITVIPRHHVSQLTALDRETMAAVLAGLTKVTSCLRTTLDVETVELRAHPRNLAARHAHLHFHAVPRGMDALIDVRERVVESVARALAG